MAVVLVTGAFGNVGRHCVRALRQAGHLVVATDLDSPQAQRAAREFAADPGVSYHPLNLTDTASLTDLVCSSKPDAVLHLAAIIPPMTYTARDVAYAVNVTATQVLCEAASHVQARMVFASSIAVYGARNPTMEPVTALTPVAPRDAYGADKVRAEELVKSLTQRWTILRLGAVVFPDMSLAMDLDSLYLEGLLPGNARIHSVDARDVAAAFVAAVDADCEGMTLLIGGDDSHRRTQHEMSAELTAAVGLRKVLPTPLPGNPAKPEDWFMVDWMDTREAEEVLQFQGHSWAETVNDLRAHLGLRTRLMPIVAPLARRFFAQRWPYRDQEARYAEPWPGIVQRWGPGAFDLRIGQS